MANQNAVVVSSDEAAEIMREMIATGKTVTEVLNCTHDEIYTIALRKRLERAPVAQNGNGE